MATIQPRTRSRVNSTRPTTTKPRPPTSATNSTHGSATISPALSSLFTNLRLLDLDTSPGWPDVTVDTFAATGVQGQKRRVRCVEWILVKLFELWNEEEAAVVRKSMDDVIHVGRLLDLHQCPGKELLQRLSTNICQKLKPFFPAADQIQSVNLRSALLRLLETAKKNGILGRDSVIRKTMLDDCKGERLEEVLAYFSTAVLKKVLEEDIRASGDYPPVAMGLAFENKGYTGDNTELNALVLAYKSSLCRFLEHKENIRATYRDFGDLLSVKERGVARRLEAIRAKEADCNRDTLSNNAREEMRRLVRNNWSGNENWMQVLVQGDFADKRTGLLAMPFDRVWRRVQQGRLAEVEENSGGLLEQLDSRVRVQKERLARWDVFRKRTFGQLTQAPLSPSKQRALEKKPSRGIDFNFAAHVDLQVGKSISLGMGIGKTSKLNKEHEDLLEGLREDLSRIRSTDSLVLGNIQKGNFRRRYGGSFGQSTDGAETISEISELEDEPYEPIPATIPIRTNRTKLQSLRRHPVKPQMRHSEVFNQSTSTTGSLSPPPQAPIRQQEIYRPPVEDFEDIEPPPSPTQNMADEILESMEHASPSPSKHKQRPTLSLAQRTRLSMAGNHSPFLDEEPELPLRPATTNKHGPTPPSESESSKPADNEAMDLVSRTRLSMAGFEKAQKKAQVERRKSLRKSKVLPRKEGSYFPKVQEEEEKGHAELTEELIMEEDMEAVFKSRPKVKASPVGSPTREWDE